MNPEQILETICQKVNKENLPMHEAFQFFRVDRKQMDEPLKIAINIVQEFFKYQKNKPRTAMQCPFIDWND